MTAEARGWRFNRELNAGHLLIAIPLIVGMVASYYDLRGRIERREDDALRQREVLVEIKDTLKAFGARDEDGQRADRETLGRLIRFETRVEAINETLKMIRQEMQEMRADRRSSPAPRFEDPRGGRGETGVPGHAVQPVSIPRLETTSTTRE